MPLFVLLKFETKLPALVTFLKLTLPLNKISLFEIVNGAISVLPLETLKVSAVIANSEDFPEFTKPIPATLPLTSVLIVY